MTVGSWMKPCDGYIQVDKNNKKNIKKKNISRITNEWKVYHSEYYLNGFADYIG